MAPKLCSLPNCSRPSRARGLCLSHYSTGYKDGVLPPKERKQLYVCQKIYLTKEQAYRVKQLAAKQEKPASELLRNAVAEFLRQCDADEEGTSPIHQVTLANAD